MPYNNISELPASIRKVLPESGQKVFLEVFNSSYAKHRSDSVAMEMAWGVVKKRFKRVDGMFVANSSDYETPQLYSFSVEVSDNEFILNSDGDEVILDAVLATTEKRASDGAYFDEEGLSHLAEQINSGGSALPDVDHAVFLNTLKQAYGLATDKIVELVKQQKGVFKSIKAAVKNGKLWIKAILDKRYKNHVSKFKALSIEAVGKRDSTGRILNPAYVGFTFTDKPNLQGAKIAV